MRRLALALVCTYVIAFAVTAVAVARVVGFDRLVLDQHVTIVYLGPKSSEDTEYIIERRTNGVRYCAEYEAGRELQRRPSRACKSADDVRSYILSNGINH